MERCAIRLGVNIDHVARWVPFAHVAVVGEIIDKLVDLVLAFVMFKALSREARRYMETR